MSCRPSFFHKHLIAPFYFLSPLRHSSLLMILALTSCHFVVHRGQLSLPHVAQALKLTWLKSLPIETHFDRGWNWQQLYWNSGKTEEGERGLIAWGWLRLVKVKLPFPSPLSPFNKERRNMVIRHAKPRADPVIVSAGIFAYFSFCWAGWEFTSNLIRLGLEVKSKELII